MTEWRYKFRMKHLVEEYREDTEWARLDEFLKKLAKLLDSRTYFDHFDSKKLRKMPALRTLVAADVTPRDYANRQLQRIYDYADEKHIWIE